MLWHTTLLVCYCTFFNLLLQQDALHDKLSVLLSTGAASAAASKRPYLERHLVAVQTQPHNSIYKLPAGPFVSAVAN